MAELSLKELIIKGYFGGITLGCSRSDTEHSIRQFDDWTDCGLDLAIGRYGVIEFHFDKNELFLIWCDNLTHLSAGKMKFDPWFLKKRYSIQTVIKKLEEAGVDFALTRNGENVVITITKSGAELHFEPKEGLIQNGYVLTAFGKK